MTTETAVIASPVMAHDRPHGTTQKDQLIFWVTTGIVAGIMLWSALNFAFNPASKGAFAHLGLPDWFRAELTTATSGEHLGKVNAAWRSPQRGRCA